LLDTESQENMLFSFFNFVDQEKLKLHKEFVSLLPLPNKEKI
jgi:hypothetical protein